ncbi:hypothetical protein FGO68_gene12545 [Halteria grandinella]|uniref:Steroid 5-alpha reductase C-terminal domain-containing protein n=1 Tax=Halteria grandinella TaxID=5974 RepID=A0A8J8SV98_HALGN|nr:hypothetical protein FGO68_gene12545 [Halteria grandinella]
MGTGVFVVSAVSDNYSQVDKLWSVMPAVYAWVIYAEGGKTPRQLVMASLITVWGGYSWKFWEGEEDYRWVHVRKIPFVGSKVGWFLFNLIFISFYQAYLIMGFTLPMILTVSKVQTELGVVDSSAIILIASLIVFETMADEQQQAFQNEKYRIINAKEPMHEPFKTGFITSGLFAYCRHPNYLCEQAIWASLYLFSIAATGKVINWTLTGALLLILLFQGSGIFTEIISAQKYPKYKEYQAKVPMFIPRLF